MKKILVLILALALCLVGVAFADEKDMRSSVPVPGVGPGVVTVTGEAVVTIPADMATIRLGVRVTSEDVSELQNEINTGIASIREALVGFGISNDDITTSSLSIYPNYDYSDAMERIVSYSGYNTLCVVVNDITKTGDVIDVAFGAGANTLDDVSFGVKDDSEARDKAYALAVEDAIHRADVIAKAAGTGCSEILEITAGSAYNYYENNAVYYNRAESMSVEDAAGTDVNAAGIYVNANVTVKFGLIGE